MKKVLCIAFVLVCSFMLAGCVDHNDGVCDYKGCDMTISVVRYDKNHEFCLEHAIDAGISNSGASNNASVNHATIEIDEMTVTIITFAVLSIVFIIVICLCFSSNGEEDIEKVKGEKNKKENENSSNNKTELLKNQEKEDLKKYKELLDEGLITEEDFENKKKQILGL